MELFKGFKTDQYFINVIKAKKYTWIFSIGCCLIAIVSLFSKGLNFSLEFTGGTQLEISCNNPVSVDHLIDRLERAKFRSPRVQSYGSSKNFLIRLNERVKTNKQGYNDSADPGSTATIADAVIQALDLNEHKVAINKIEYIGSEVGDKLLEQGAIAVVISILATMLYIAIRFEYRLALSAAITLFHNAVIVLGCFSIFNCEFDLATLAAILAIIGYSLNDTIVIFDRIRENFRKYHKESVKEIINFSVNQTLSRTIMTSFLTLLVVVSLLCVGGKSLFGFALALTIGILIGTYASIYISSSVALWMGLSRQDFLIKR